MLREYYDWWARQMLDLVPEQFRVSSVADADALLIQPENDASGQPAFIELVLVRNRRTSRLGRFGLDTAAIQAAGRAAQATERAGTVRLVLPAQALLEKRLTLPLAAERDLERVLTYEMDRETPFAAPEVWWSFAIEQRDRVLGKLTVRLSLVPKATLAAFIQSLEHAGLGPAILEIPMAAGPSRQIAMAGSGRQGGQWHRRRLPMAMAACAVLALLAIAVPFIRQAVALNTAKERIAALKPAVDEADKLRAQLTGGGGSDVLAAERARVGDPLAVLAAATTLLPNDTYLTDFTMQQRKLTLNGQSVGPAKLIGALAADPTFKDPAFAAPSTHAEGARTDVFSISAEARN